MRRLLWVGTGIISVLTACNYDEGECWRRDENGNVGVGGSIVPTGAGGFGDVPPQPQDATDPPPDCLTANSGPCNEKCLKNYEAAGEKCSDITEDAQRKTCQDSAYATYKNCRESCTKQADCKELCKSLCDQIHDGCHESCNKNDPTASCHSKCNGEYSACLKKCDQKC